MIKNLYTVSQLNKYVKDVINAAFVNPVWICGEVQGYNRNKSKSHIFFELVEKNKESEDIVARIGLVIFAGRKAFIEHVLKKSENGFELKDDIEVKFSCKIDFYPPHGAMRLIVENIDPTYTLGKLAQQRQKIIAALKKKGILDKNKKRDLPIVPLNIGLITSHDSAAYNDFISELKRSKYGFKVYSRNTIMQGPKFEKDVCQAIDELHSIKNIDAIVITRGGGSIADLSGFDNQKVVEKIAACELPVLSGIGHEINISITDMAAHTYAKTPTAIAQFLVCRVEDFVRLLDEKMKRINEHSTRVVREEKQHLKDLSVNLQNYTRDYLKTYNGRLIELTQILKTRPGVYIKDHNRQVLEHKNQLLKVVNKRFQDESLKINNYSKMIGILHPENTLKRGFSITRTREGKILKRIKDVQHVEELVTQLADGEIISHVEQVKGENKNV